MNTVISQTPFSFLHPDVCSIETLREQLYDAYEQSYEEFYTDHYINRSSTEWDFLVCVLNKYAIPSWIAKRAYCFDDVPELVTRREIEVMLVDKPELSPEDYFAHYHPTPINFFHIVGPRLEIDLIQAIHLFRLHLVLGAETVYIPKGEIW